MRAGTANLCMPETKRWACYAKRVLPGGRFVLEQLKMLIGAMNPPTHPHVGEAFLCHKSLTAYYYLRVKCALYERHSQSPELREFWHDAMVRAEQRIKQLETIMDDLGIPKPPSMPLAGELTDQFMVLDGLAMIQGMLVADVIGLQSVKQPALAALYTDMIDSTTAFGARLMTVVNHEGWGVMPPPYNTSANQ